MIFHEKQRGLFRPLASAVEKLEDRRLLAADFRSIDGTGNNLTNPTWGSAGSQLLRLTTVEYEDGQSTPAGGATGQTRPNAREISNLVSRQDRDIINNRELTSFVFQWGQFIDHDLDLTEEAIDADGNVDNFSIPVPANDPDMIPDGFIPVLRSRFDEATGTSAENPRQQVNQITSFIDASNVYGSDVTRAATLRLGQGGLMRTSAGGLLPYNTFDPPLYNAAPPPLGQGDYFAAGDIRANEQPGLTSLHTLFVREHNRLATEIAESEFAGRDLSDVEVDEAIYQKARQIVGALLQSITYNEFLPALLGPNGVASYLGYDSLVNPSVANIFSAAIYRIGHTMLPNELLQVNNDGAPVAGGSIPLADTFFQPSILAGLGIEPFLMGLSVQRVQEIDALVNDSVRSMLFDPPAQFDLAAINMQRGRDHGLPDYNQARVDFGLAPMRNFHELSAEFGAALAQAYRGDINNIDVWLGAISEEHIAGGSVGELAQTVLVDQFQRLRDGDRFYFENVLSGDLLREVQETRLADIIRRNTQLNSIQDEVFRTGNVFVFRAPVDSSTHATVDVDRNQIRVIDSNTGEVLAERDKRGVSHVVIFGSGQDDNLAISSSAIRRGVSFEIHGLGGNDRLQLIGSNASDNIVIGDGQIRFNSMPVYFGTIEAVEVTGRGGSDMVDGYESSVPLIVSTGAGSDFVIGSRFNDFVFGGNGFNVIFGMDGNDLLVGGSGLDTIFGGDGDDILIGGGRRDLMMGGRGRDIIIQGMFPGEDDRDGSLWDEAFAQWIDDMAKFGLL
ncbi:MAG: peroxidase [Planctomycetales bacterium]|nr:peroxidase [Planctomycetales bacterium]